MVKDDPSLSKLISDGAQLVPVLKDFNFTEGATYVSNGDKGILYFTDLPSNKVYKLALRCRRQSVCEPRSVDPVQC